MKCLLTIYKPNNFVNKALHLPARQNENKQMKNELSIPDAIIANKIFLVRNNKVMLDSDLADL